MADVTFRRGVEANLPTAGMATEGCVYHSTDTGNIYMGSSQGTLIPVNRSPYYGTCPTQSGTNAKVVTLDVDNDNFTMNAGVMISVLFSNANTAASPTLNVNGKGAVSVKVYGTTNVSASPRAWEAGEVVTFVHNGTHWVMVGHKVQSDWNQTDTAAVDFIKNKPTNVSAFTNDAGYITTNDIPEGAAASTTTPKMDGVAEIGTELAFARGDHRHPSDTSKQDKLTAGTDLEIVPISVTLPNGYTQLDYIKSTGQQCIDTGYSLTGTDTLEIDYILTQSSSGGNKCIARQAPYTWIENYGSSNQWYVRFGGSSSSNTAYNSSHSTGTIVLKKNYFGINGTRILQPSYNSMGTGGTLELFGALVNGNVSYPSYIIISEARVKNSSDIIIHRYIPAKRNSDNAIGMYDVTAEGITSQGFRQNLSNTPFVAGSPTQTGGAIINFTNDTGYITSADLATVAISGSYNDLSDTPTIPNDNNLVHKTGNENVSGTKTFNNNVMLGTNANLVLSTAQDEGVYIEANSSSGGQQALTFSSLDDDSAVKLENVALPTANTDAANKQYVDDAIGNTYVSLKGTTNASAQETYSVYPYSLCAFSTCVYPQTYMIMTSLALSGGISNKTPYTAHWFPIGCKIYYYNEGTALSGAFSSHRFYTTYNGVDARCSAVTGDNIDLFSDVSGGPVYLRVEIRENNFEWRPYHKQGETNEIIVSGAQLEVGGFYIYLGRSVVSSDYMFQLEDNNPLYACVMDGSGTHLVDWASYNSSRTPYLVKRIQLFPSSQFPIGNNPIIGKTGIYSRQSYLDSSYLEGVYKVTLQLHAWWDYPTGTLDTPQPLSVIVKHNTNDKIAGGTFVIPVMESPNDSHYKMGTIVVNLVGFVTFTSAQTTNDYIEVKVQGSKGINLGGEHPLWGENEGDVEYNDGLILERIDWYNPT